MEWMQTHSSHRYPTSLTDEEWEQIKSLVPTPKSGVGKRGRPIGLERRELADAIFYIVRSGCSWRMLPSDFGPWQTVYGYFRKWSQRSEEHTSELQSLTNLVCRLLLEKKKNKKLYLT